MNKITKLIFISVAGVALTACGGDNGSNNSVDFADLIETGLNGYKINVTLDFDVADDPDSSIDYYFCTENVEGLDYYANTSEFAGVPIEDEPDFDYGFLSIPDPGVLLFSENAVSSDYVILSEEETLEEGQTYDYDAEDSDYSGTVTVNNISNYSCPTI